MSSTTDHRKKVGSRVYVTSVAALAAHDPRANLEQLLEALSEEVIDIIFSQMPHDDRPTSGEYEARIIIEPRGTEC